MGEFMPRRINKFASRSYVLPRLHNSKYTKNVSEDAALYIAKDLGRVGYGVGFLLSGILTVPFRLPPLLWHRIGIADVIITLTHVVGAPAKLMVAPYVAWADSMRYADKLAGFESYFWQRGLAFLAGVCTFPLTLVYSLVSVTAAVVINIAGGLAADVANLFEVDLNSYDVCKGIFV
jgi:hypothetical protein